MCKIRHRDDNGVALLHPRGVHRTIHVHIDISSSTNTVHGHLQYTAHVLGHISGERHRGKINICLTRYMSTLFF